MTGYKQFSFTRNTTGDVRRRLVYIRDPDNNVIKIEIHKEYGKGQSQVKEILILPEGYKCDRADALEDAEVGNLERTIKQGLEENKNADKKPI